MSVRVGGLEDLEAILALDRGAEGPHWRRADYLEALAGEVGRLRRRVLLADQEDQIAGFVVMQVLRVEGPPTGEIEHVVVAAEWRRRGLGRELCAAGLAWARGLGCLGIGLEVRESNAAAIALYEGLGFHVSGRRPRYYRQPEEDALRMDIC